MKWLILVAVDIRLIICYVVGDSSFNDESDEQDRKKYSSEWKNSKELINDQNEREIVDYYKNNQKELGNSKYDNMENRGRIPEYRSRSDGSFYRYNEEEKEKLDKIFGYTGPTANDEPENLIRPCALDDWQCIRHYFAANSNCNPSYGPIPDPLTLDLLIIYFSSVNMTITLPNSVVRGLSSAKVKEFYVNKKSGNLVFAMDVINLNETTQRAYFRYRRTAKESIILSDYSTVNFRSVTMTAVIPKVPHLRLDLADVHVDSKDGYPIYLFGPGATNSTDTDVITASQQIAVLLPLIVREGLLFYSQLLTAIFIQTTICDFGLKLISI